MTRHTISNTLKLSRNMKCPKTTVTNGARLITRITSTNGKVVIDYIKQ